MPYRNKPSSSAQGCHKSLKLYPSSPKIIHAHALLNGSVLFFSLNSYLLCFLPPYNILQELLTFSFLPHFCLFGMGSACQLGLCVLFCVHQKSIVHLRRVQERVAMFLHTMGSWRMNVAILYRKSDHRKKIMIWRFGGG